MDGGLPAGAIFGLCVGGLIVIINITVIVTCCIKRKNVYDQTTVCEQTPVVVTSATHTAPSGYTATQMPIGSTVTSYQTQTYTAPYPPQGNYAHLSAGQSPVPGVHSNAVSYPVIVSGSMNPPSYDVAVSHIVVNERQTSNYRM